MSDGRREAFSRGRIEAVSNNPTSSMHALAIALVLPVSVNLDTLSLPRARTLDGKLVIAKFIVWAPPFYWGGRTFVGTSDKPDGVERCASLKGKHLDLDLKPIVVFGVLRVYSTIRAGKSGWNSYHPGRKFG